MTEYTSDPAAVAAYYAARARTADWLHAVSPPGAAARASAPPSLVADTDDGLSSPESEAASELSLPPRMTLKYPDGRLVSIGPSREERERVERLRRARASGAGGKERALYVPPPREPGVQTAPSAHSGWRQAPYAVYPLYAPAPQTTRTHYPALPSSRAPTSFHPAAASHHSHHSIAPSYHSVAPSHSGTAVPQDERHVPSHSTTIAAPSPVYAFEADKSPSILEQHVADEEEHGTPVPRTPTPVLAEEITPREPSPELPPPPPRPPSEPHPPTLTSAPEPYHPRQATASGASSQRSRHSSRSRHARHASAPPDAPTPTPIPVPIPPLQTHAPPMIVPSVRSGRSSSRAPPAIIYAAANRDGSYEAYAPPRILPASQYPGASSRSQPHLPRSPPRVAPSISDPLPVPAPAPPAYGTVGSRRERRPREKRDDSWEKIRASQVPAPEQLPPVNAPHSPFAFARLPRLPGRPRAAAAAPPMPVPPPQKQRHEARSSHRPPPGVVNGSRRPSSRDRDGSPRRGRRGERRASEEDDGAESESSGSTYYILPSPGQKVYVVEPPDEWSLAQLQRPPGSTSAQSDDWARRARTLPSRAPGSSARTRTPASISQALYAGTGSHDTSVLPVPPPAGPPHHAYGSVRTSRERERAYYAPPTHSSGTSSGGGAVLPVQLHVAGEPRKPLLKRIWTRR